MRVASRATSLDLAEHQHSHTLTMRQITQELAHLDDARGIQTVRRLVKDQQLGIM